MTICYLMNCMIALTIDEQPLAFRGRCLFRMYISNKPAKYSLKLLMICDVATSYLLNAIPYPGTLGTRSQKNLPGPIFIPTATSQRIIGLPPLN